MYYILYIDRLFFLNFCMDFFALMLTNISLGRKISYFRIILSAGVGAAGCIAMLFLPGLPYVVKVLTGFAGLSVIMIWLLYPKGKLQFFIKALTNLYGFSFLLGGVLLFLKRYIKTDGNNYIFTVLLPSAVVFFLVRFLLKRKREVQNECEVILNCAEKQLKVKAFIDSGNMLTEPISKKPVSIVEAECLKKAGIIMPDEKCKVIPYHSVGKRNGILMGFEFPEMRICGRNMDKSVEKVIVAVSEDNLFSSGKYQMILHPQLLEGEEFHGNITGAADKKDWRKLHDIENSNAGQNTV